jgi:hypothetical protein
MGYRVGAGGRGRRAGGDIFRDPDPTHGAPQEGTRRAVEEYAAACGVDLTVAQQMREHADEFVDEAAAVGGRPESTP